MNKIDSFSGPYRFLSNFYKAPTVYLDIEYPTSENAYQAAKSECSHMRRYFKTLTPGQAKHHGRMIIIRKDWESVKFNVMSEIVLDKFTRNPELGQRLIETGNAYLEEGNTWNDTYWGVCNGVGANNLGLILMRVRKKLNEKQL